MKYSHTFPLYSAITMATHELSFHLHMPLNLFELGLMLPVTTKDSPTHFISLAPNTATKETYVTFIIKRIAACVIKTGNFEFVRIDSSDTNSKTTSDYDFYAHSMGCYSTVVLRGCHFRHVLNFTIFCSLSK